MSPTLCELLARNRKPLMQSTETNIMHKHENAFRKKILKMEKFIVQNLNI